MSRGEKFNDCWREENKRKFEPHFHPIRRRFHKLTKSHFVAKK